MVFLTYEPKTNCQKEFQSNDDWFLTFMGLCNFTSFLKVKLLIKITITTTPRKNKEKMTRIVVGQIMGSVSRGFCQHRTSPS